MKILHQILNIASLLQPLHSFSNVASLLLPLHPSATSANVAPLFLAYINTETLLINYSTPSSTWFKTYFCEWTKYFVNSFVSTACGPQTSQLRRLSTTCGSLTGKGLKTVVKQLLEFTEHFPKTNGNCKHYDFRVKNVGAPGHEMLIPCNCKLCHTDKHNEGLLSVQNTHDTLTTNQYARIKPHYDACINAGAIKYNAACVS